MRIFVVIAILVSIVLLIIVAGNKFRYEPRNESRYKSDLKVETQGVVLKLINTGVTPVTITNSRGQNAGSSGPGHACRHASMIALLGALKISALANVRMNGALRDEITSAKTPET
jgi:hypothetical protein